MILLNSQTPVWETLA